MGVASPGEPPSQFELTAFSVLIGMSAILMVSAVVYLARLALNW